MDLSKEFGNNLIAQFLYFTYTSEVVGAIWTMGIGLGSSVRELLAIELHAWGLTFYNRSNISHFLFSFYPSNEA